MVTIVTFRGALTIPRRSPRIVRPVFLFTKKKHDAPNVANTVSGEAAWKYELIRSVGEETFAYFFSRGTNSDA